MKFVLFMMFFVSPPAKPGTQVWTLNNTASFEFETMEACKTFGQLVQARLASTATTTMRGWCVNKQTGVSTFDVSRPGARLPPSEEFYEIEVPKGH
jgi:hypothetical protein